MIKVIVLTEDDIREIIANAFDVDKDQVQINIQRGHIDTVEAIIDLPMNEQR